MGYLVGIENGNTRQNFGVDKGFFHLGSGENQIKLLKDSYPFGIFSSNDLMTQNVSHVILQSDDDILSQ